MLQGESLDAAIQDQAELKLSLNFMYQGQPHEITPGLYFGMPENLYHALPWCLSSTGFKNLQISAPDFYFNCWLNPLKDEDAEDEDAKEWRRFGKASHTRNLEGKAIFDQLYCVEFIAPEGCLDTVAELKKACDDLGIPAPSKWKKADYIQAIMAANPSAMIYEVEKERYWRSTQGRIQLTEKEMRRIEIAAKMIEAHPELKHAFVGGYAEVSVIWVEDGIWFKARFDYLKPRAIVDLKTFTNQLNKPIDIAIHQAMAAMKYHIQCAHYTRGADWAAGFARAGIMTTYSVNRFGPDPEFMKELGESEGHEFYHIWQKKGGAPLARGKKFQRDLSMMKCGEASVQQAIELYKKYFALFGEGVWVDQSSITNYEDGMFPAYATEI